MRVNNLLLASTAAVAMLAIPAAAQAQDGENTADAAAQSEDDPFNTIVVTAQRREQSVQDVGASVTAFGGEELAAARFTDVEDVAGLVPNIDIKSALGGQNQVITIRGVGLNDFSSNNTGSVGVYIDDVFLASVAGLEFGMFDSERLEVLKGPQGTLYGRNATGGAINIISQRPLFENSGFVRIGAGNYGLLEAEGAANFQLSDSAAFRLSGRVADQNSFYRNSTTDQRLPGTTSWGVRGQLAFEGEGWNANLKVQTSRDEGGATPYNHVGTLTPQSAIDAEATAAFLMFPEFAPLLATDPAVGLGGVGAFCAPVLAGTLSPSQCADTTGFQDPTAEIRDTTSNFAVGNEVDVKATDVTLHLNFELGAGELTSITGWRSLDRTFGEDTDAQSRTLFEIAHDTEVEQFSQELRYNLSGSVVDLVLGLFYSWDDVQVDNTILSDEFFLTRLNVAVDQQTETFAAFGHAEFEVATDLTLVAGLRYTYESKDYAGGTLDQNPFGISLLLLDPVTFQFFPDPLQLSSTNVNLEENDISGTLGLEYRPNTDTLIYATASRGFKSGGVIGDITFSNEELTPFEPETVYAYEVGIRSDPLDNLRFNAAGFYYDYSNVQTFVQGSLGPVLGNVESAEVFGADVEIVWAPTADLRFNVGLGLLDTELGGNTPLAGNELPNAPSVSLNAGVNYDIYVSDTGILTFGADVKHSSSIERNAENDPLTTTEAFTVFNARVGFEDEESGWGVAVWGKNLFEEDYAEQTFNLPTLGLVIEGYNTPMTWGATVSKKF